MKCKWPEQDCDLCKKNILIDIEEFYYASIEGEITIVCKKCYDDKKIDDNLLNQRFTTC